MFERLQNVLRSTQLTMSSSL